MLWDVKLDIFWRNLSLILLFSILESKYESLHKCYVYKDWLILGGICYSVSYYMDMYMSYSTKRIKEKNVLVSCC